jgi:hypothetical protein
MDSPAEVVHDDRDERRVVALRKTLRSFLEASRRAGEGGPGIDPTDEALEADALRRVARAIVSDDDEDDERAS